MTEEILGILLPVMHASGHVKKRVELAQWGIALQKIYVLLFVIIKYSVICFQNMGNGHCDYNKYKSNTGTISKETLVKPVTDLVKCIYGLSPVHRFHLT